jgi:hypothetical protein
MIGRAKWRSNIDRAMAWLPNLDDMYTNSEWHLRKGRSYFRHRLLPFARYDCGYL